VTLQGTHHFQPVVVEPMGTVEEATSSFLTELSHRISALSGDNREISFYRAMHFSAKRGIAIACRLSVCLSVCNVGEL